MSNPNPREIATALTALDSWFDGLRTRYGIGGPVAHWWESSLLYCGPMIDWRYEGILSGCVELYRKSKAAHWLDKAITAGNEVCAAQLPDGRFWNSSFQLGPIEGGTPHEAAVDVGLLELAALLYDLKDERWQVYFHAAERNLLDFQLSQLWHSERQAFRDQPGNMTFVPNKNGTTLEALLLYEQLSGREMKPYIIGAAALMLSGQIKKATPYQGGTIHLGTGEQRLAIGIYTARNVGALIRLYSYYPEQVYLDAAIAMGAFLETLLKADGTAFGYYPDGRMILCPTWVSPSGDFLRAFLALQPFVPDMKELSRRIAQLLIAQQLPSGGIPTSHGLSRKGSTHFPQLKPDFRDVLPVAGWCDKAFRGLAQYLPDDSHHPIFTTESSETRVSCTWKGVDCLYIETRDEISLHKKRNGQQLYQWLKQQTYPTVYKL